MTMGPECSQGIRQYGIGLLSLYPLVRVRVLYYGEPKVSVLSSETEPRVAVLATILSDLTNWRDLAINTHLTYGGTSTAAVRRAQLANLDHALRTEPDFANGARVLICGDFNEDCISGFHRSRVSVPTTPQSCLVGRPIADTVARTVASRVRSRRLPRTPVAAEAVCHGRLNQTMALAGPEI
jgi:endonuclease/exonuclease/phosphatase family metal-dependent hydrolase